MCIFMKHISKDDDGFTLLETLISLLISTFVIMLLTGGLLNIVSIRDTMAKNAQTSNKSNIITGDRQVEWHIFLNQMENYLQDSYEPEVTGSNIYVKEPLIDGGVQNVIYRTDANSINFSRRLSSGYHRLLTGITKLHFTREGGWLIADVTFENGDTFSGRIWTASWIEEDVEEEEEEEEENVEEGEEKEELEEGEAEEEEKQEVIEEQPNEKTSETEDEDEDEKKNEENG